MYADFESWMAYTSTKEKERHIISYLESNSIIDDEARDIIDAEMFDDNNIPFAFPNVELIFDELGIDKNDFIEFVDEQF